MSDDLSPAEQARAHRLSSDWLGSVDPVTGFEAEAVGYSRHRLLRQADALDPPETVESLRAERDAEHDAWQSAENALHAAVDELRAAEADVAHWREQFRLVCDESKERTTERDAALTNARTWEDLADGWRDRANELRGDVREANDTIVRLRATHTEAARGHCARED